MNSVELVNNNDTNKKKPDIIDEVAKTGIKGFNYTSKLNGLVKSTLKIVDTFDKVPAPLEELMVAVKSFKIIKGMLAIPKLCKSVIKVMKPSSVENRLLNGWGIIKSVKKIVGAVETVFYYLKKLNLVSKAALTWTTVTGYIFMPVTFISAGLTTYKFGKITKQMTDFRAQLKQAKRAGDGSSVEVSKRVCALLLTQVKPLGKAKVITKECPLKDRLKSILTRLKSDNEEIRLLAADEAKLIRKRLKDRISEHVGVAAVDTALATVGVVATILSLVCPPAAVALVIVGLASTVLGLANLAYSKFIPQGDIFATEKRMLFSHMFKKMRTATRAIEAAVHRLAERVQGKFCHKVDIYSKM
jgi:hypothetical protein